MQVGDHPVRVRVEGVVRGIPGQGRGLHERVEVAGPGPEEGLAERLDRPVHHGEGDPAVARLPDDRPLVGEVDPEGALHQGPLGRPPGDGDLPRDDRSLLCAVAIGQLAAPVEDLHRKLIDRIHAAGGVHPPHPGVEALVDEELSPGRRAVDIEPGVGGHLLLGPEIEACVGVDQQEGAAAPGTGGADGNAIGAPGLLGSSRRRAGQDPGPVGVQVRQAVQRNPFDVAADAALREAEGHPGLKSL